MVPYFHYPYRILYKVISLQDSESLQENSEIISLGSLPKMKFVELSYFEII